MYVDDVQSNPAVAFHFDFNNLAGQARMHIINPTIVQPPLGSPLRSYNHAADVPPIWRYNSGPIGAPIVAGIPDFSQNRLVTSGDTCAMLDATHAYDDAWRNRMLYGCVDNHVGVTYHERWWLPVTPGTFPIHMNP
jgi:hypothetical protein